MQVEEQLESLRQAEKQANLIIGTDSSLHAQIVRGVLPLAQGSEPKLKKWLAQFLASTFTSTAFPFEERAKLAFACLDTLLVLASSSPSDSSIMLHVSLTCASIYPYILKQISQTASNAAKDYTKINALKNLILRQWDDADIELKIACIKFAQVIVLCQTTSTDSQIHLQEDIFRHIPENHPLLQPSLLEAEAKGLLDRLIFSMIDNIPCVSVVFTATINVLVIIAKARPSLCTKIISAMLGVDLLKLNIHGPSASSMKLQFISIVKCMKSALNHMLRFGLPQNLLPRTQHYLAYLNSYTRNSYVATDSNRKRPASDHEPDPMKRQRNYDNTQHTTTLSSYEWANLLSTSNYPYPLSGFDVTQLNQSIISSVTFVILQHVNIAALNNTIGIIRSRLHPNQIDPRDVHNSTSNYADPNQTSSVIETSSSSAVPATNTKMSSSLKPIVEAESSEEQLFMCVDRLLDAAFTLEKLPTSALTLQTNLTTQKWSRECAQALVCRIATRGLFAHNGEIGKGNAKNEDHDNTSPLESIGFKIKERILEKILDNFKAGMDLALNWLTEEWYNDQVHSQEYDHGGNYKGSSVRYKPQYEYWALRVIDSVMPFLEQKDRYITVFFSELPELTHSIVARFKKLLVDPQKAALGFNILQYLITLRLPCRDACLNVVEETWKEKDANNINSCEKILKKWRPNVLVSD